MRTAKEIQSSPLWHTIYAKLTQEERDLFVETAESIVKETKEECAKIAYTYADGHSDIHKFAGHTIGRLILGTSSS